MLAAPIEAPAIRRSLRKLRLRRASVCFIEHVDSNTVKTQNQDVTQQKKLNTGAMPQKISGGGVGAGPQVVASFASFASFATIAEDLK